MDLTSKQRAQLRAMANTIDSIITVGKGGISDELVEQVRDALEARELVKGNVLDNAEYDAREVCEILARRTAAAQVQVIGKRFVLYRPSHRKDKKDRIVLVK